MAEVLTIGAYGWSAATFFDELVTAGVGVFCDTRRRRGVRGAEYAFVNSTRLQRRLRELGIEYRHRLDLAPSAATRQIQAAEDERTGIARRERLGLSRAFASAYTEECLGGFDAARFLAEFPACARICLFCVEREPTACHRSLIAERLASAGPRCGISFRDSLVVAAHGGLRRCRRRRLVYDRDEVAKVCAKVPARFRRAIRVRSLAVLLLLGGVLELSSAAPAFGAQGAITARGAAAAAPHSTKRPTLTLPARAKPGDVVLAWLGLRRIGPDSRPNLRAPTGWKLVSRTHKGALGSLAVYWHVVAAGETRYIWKASERVGGVAFIAAFGGVDTINPIDVSRGAVIKGRRRAISTPSVTTTVAGDTLVSSYFAYQRQRASPSWKPASGMRKIRDAANSTGRSGSLQYGVQATAGPSGRKTARAPAPQDDAIAVLTALRPATPVPLIVDTDIFSDADDVGALATAFALQIRHEAHVLAIGVNTRTNRPAVTTNSWKCAAAVAQFYGAGNIPLGTDMPNNGTELNTADFAGPCATLASPATPVPQSAVSVFRQALVGQADGSVVFAESGYSENLAALLSSPGDAISPLSGRDLIAQKVKELVILAGGYPSRSSETNLAGNPAAAQTVAANWPTKIVWSGYEIGDALHTGDTISRVHPANSPVRVSYEAFVGPNKWTYSYDLIAVYYAVRPGGSLVEEGPGTNTIDSSGGNVFTPGAGNQYYLKLTNGASVEASLEALLDTLPGK